MMPARADCRIHGAAQLPRVSVMTTAFEPRARLEQSVEPHAEQRRQLCPGHGRRVSIERYSAGIAANAARERRSSIFASSASLGSSV